MKYLIAFLLLVSVSARSQTLVLTNHMHPTLKSKLTCVTPAFTYIAEAAYTNTAMFPSNKWYYPTTNVVTATASNTNSLITISSSFGATLCGRGFVSYTNPLYPQDTFAYNEFWPTNLFPVPTNGEWVSITVTGVRTNGP